MTRDTAKQVFGLAVRLAGLYTILAHAIPLLMMAFDNGRMAFIAALSAVAGWWLLFRADALVRRSYPASHGD